jgi:hypothetical protein
MGLDNAIKALASATEPTSVPLAGKVVRVLPPMDWRQSAMTAIRRSDFDTWARACLVNDLEVVDGKPTGSDDVAIWLEADPTNREVVQFMADYEAAAGQDLGK